MPPRNKTFVDLCVENGLTDVIDLLVGDFVYAAVKMEGFLFKRPTIKFEFSPDDIEHASDIACRCRMVIDAMNRQRLENNQRVFPCDS